MNKLVTDNPQNNGEHMLNLAFVKDGEVWIRNGSADGETDCSLVDFCSRMCAGSNECCYTEVHGKAPYKSGDSLDDICDLLMECSGGGCPVGTTYFAMIQAAELRERLRMYEDQDVMPDELERLKKCRHECKIDCLLETHDKGMAKNAALIDRAVTFIDHVIAMTSCAEDYEIDFQLKLLQDMLREGK